MPELRLVVVQPIPLHADEVLLRDRFVTGLDHGRQIADHVETTLLVLQALDDVALAHQIPGDLDGRTLLGHARAPGSRPLTSWRNKPVASASKATQRQVKRGMSGQERRMRT